MGLYVLVSVIDMILLLRFKIDYEKSEKFNF